MILCRAKRALFAFAQRSGAMKAPVGLLSDRTVLRSKMEGPCPDKFRFGSRNGYVVGGCRPVKGCITNPSKISDFRENLLHMLLFWTLILFDS